MSHTKPKIQLGLCTARLARRTTSVCRFGALTVPLSSSARVTVKQFPDGTSLQSRSRLTNALGLGMYPPTCGCRGFLKGSRSHCRPRYCADCSDAEADQKPDRLADADAARERTMAIGLERRAIGAVKLVSVVHCLPHMLK